MTVSTIFRRPSQERVVRSDDEIEVDVTGDALTLYVANDGGDFNSIVLERDDVREIHEALGRWLTEGGQR